MRTIITFLLLASPLLAAEPKIHRDLAYVEPNNERQTLDVYAPAEGSDHPVVFWIHGGGWRAGNKTSVQKKPEVFVEKGFVFVSTNYRFVPNVTVKEITSDIAKSIRWTYDHAKEHGGDPKSIFVMGHSAGAHLAALVCTDERYLKAEGLPLSIIKGCVPIDVSVYDIPKRLKDGGSVPQATFIQVFGDTDATQLDLSPAIHAAKGKSIPSFLILHVADRADTKAQSHWFAGKLKEAGVSAQVVAAEGKTHGTINSDLGLLDDKPTQALWEFLDGRLTPSLSEQIDSLKKLGARITLDDQGRVVGVNLSERRVVDADLLHVKGLQQLQELDLTRTRIEGPGLVNLKELPSLRMLFLNETKVDDSGVAHLKGLKTLELLGLSGIKITDTSLGQLRGLTELKKLFCLGTSVTDAGVDELRKALPQCQITH